MRESISISKPNLVLALLALSAGLPLLTPSLARAQGTETPAKSDRANQPEEDDFSETPYTEYGDFNDSEEEEEDSRFFQFGRLFGIAAGLGFETVDGNRGRLWQGGFPTFDFKWMYWFGFDLAIDFDVAFSSHYYDTSTANGIRGDVSMVRYGSNLRYYIPTRDLSAPLTFIGPFVGGGASNYRKKETYQNLPEDTDSSFGFNLLAGMEFTIKPKKTYFQIEGKMHFVNFKDTRATRFQNSNPGVDDLSGRFYTLTGNFLFTW